MFLGSAGSHSSWVWLPVLRIIEWSHGTLVVGKDLEDHQVQPFPSAAKASPKSRPQVLLAHLLNPSRDGNSSTAPDS